MGKKKPKNEFTATVGAMWDAVTDLGWMALTLVALAPPAQAAPDRSGTDVLLGDPDFAFDPDMSYDPTDPTFDEHAVDDGERWHYDNDPYHNNHDYFHHDYHHDDFDDHYFNDGLHLTDYDDGV